MPRIRRNLSLTDQTASLLEEMATTDQLTVSAWLTSVILKEAKSRNIEQIKLTLKQTKIKDASKEKGAPGRPAISDTEKKARKRIPELRSTIESRKQQLTPEHKIFYWKHIEDYLYLLESKHNWRGVLEFDEMRPIAKCKELRDFCLLELSKAAIVSPDVAVPD